MAIERAIYGSISKGIDSESAGFQYYTYTKDFKNVIENERSLEGRLTSSYTCPATFQTNDWYNETERTAADRNRASEMVEQEHPLSFCYFPYEISGSNKACFVFAKDMGHDWSNGRFATPYHSMVICDSEDLKKDPVNYCSSPSVCCNIKRSEFFPEDGELAKPSYLSYTKSLDDDDPMLALKHGSPFDRISQQDVIEFIKSQDQGTEILKMLFQAVVELKGGMSDKKIVIADSGENTLKWIAALSYLFPYKNASLISFSTYNYTPGEYDICGVYVPEFYGVSVSDDNRNYITRYEFDQAREQFVLFDRSVGYLPEIEPVDSDFTDMLRYITRKQTRLEQYKQFVLSETNYRLVDRSYISGYSLFEFLEIREMNIEGLKEGIEFAIQYGRKELKQKLLSEVLSGDSILTEGQCIDAAGAFLQHCIDIGLERAEGIEKRLFDRWIALYSDPAENDKTLFGTIGENIETLLGYKEGQLEIGFVKYFGMEKIREFLSSEPEKWKARYMESALIRHVQNSGVDISEDREIRSLFEYAFLTLFEADDEKYVASIIDSAARKLPKTEKHFAYCCMVYISLTGMRFARSAGNVKSGLVKTMLDTTGEQLKELIAIVNRLQLSEHLFPDYTYEISNSGELEQVLDKMRAFVSLCDKERDRQYVDNVMADVIKRLKQIDMQQKASSDHFVKAYQLFDECDVRFGCALVRADREFLFNGYLYHLYQEHKDLFIPDDCAENLKGILDMYGECGSEINICLAKLMIDLNDLRGSLNKTGPKTIFMAGRDALPVSLDRIPDTKGPEIPIAEKYLEAMGQLCAKFWIGTGMRPNYQGILGEYRGNESDIAVLMLNMYDFIVKNDRNKKGRKIADLAEYSIILERGEKNRDFRPEFLDSVVEDMKKGEILPILEKDLEQKKKLEKGKKGLFTSEESVPGVEIDELESLIEDVEIAFQNNKKDPLSGIKNLFGRKG